MYLITLTISSRQSIEEKLFEQELQAALNLSLSQSDHSQDSTVTPATNQEQVGEAKGEVAILIEDDENRAPSPILPTIGEIVFSPLPV